MTKKHFIALADIFVATNKDISDKHLQTPEAVYLNLLSRISDFCAKENSLFSYTKFNDYINSKAV